ncbi:MAG: LytTR family DNA-binding domain-containing protein [Bacteroidota bacterium]
MKALIIDDEAANRENLAFLLEKHCPQLHIVGKADSVESAKVIIQEVQPDLLFLDIEMPEANGFQLLEAFPDFPFEVIFVTAYDHYALKAIKFAALDYLLKPVDPLELQAAVNKAAEKRQPEQKTSSWEVFKAHQNHQGPKKLALASADRIDYVPLEDIVRCQGENNYTSFFLVDGRKLVVSKPLKEYELLLNQEGFIRSHQSHLVNVRYVRSFEKREGGYLKMQDQTQIPVSQQRRKMVLEELARAMR